MSTFDSNVQAPDAPIWSTAIKWGAISGGVGVVLTMIFYNMGLMEPGGSSMNGLITTLVMIGIGLAIVYLGLKEYRSANNGQLALGRGIVWALGFGVIAGIIGAIFSFIFFSFLAPEFITDTMELQMAEMEEQGMGEEEMEVAAGYTEMFMSPVVFAVFGFLGQIFYALIQGLIASIALKTR